MIETGVVGGEKGDDAGVVFGLAHRSERQGPGHTVLSIHVRTCLLSSQRVNFGGCMRFQLAAENFQHRFLQRTKPLGGLHEALSETRFKMSSSTVSTLSRMALPILTPARVR